MSTRIINLRLKGPVEDLDQTNEQFIERSGIKDGLKEGYDIRYLTEIESVSLNVAQFNALNNLYVKYKERYPNWRKGQCAFNAFYHLFPDKANVIRGTKHDPFHKDDATEFFTFILNYPLNDENQ